MHKKNRFKDHKLTVTIINANGKVKTAFNNAIDPEMHTDRKLRAIKHTTWGKLVKYLDTKFQIADKPNLDAIIPCSWVMKNYKIPVWEKSKDQKLNINGVPMIARVGDNVDKVHCIVLDVDGKAAPIHQFIGSHRHLQFFLHTSSNHKVEKGSGDRYRVFLPLKTPVSINELAERTMNITKYFNRAGEVIDDKSTFTKGRLFYLPGVASAEHVENYFKHYSNGFDLFDVMSFQTDVIKPKGKIQTHIRDKESPPNYVSYYDLSDNQRGEMDGRFNKSLNKCFSESKKKGNSASYRLAFTLRMAGAPIDLATSYVDQLKSLIGSKCDFNTNHQVKSGYSDADKKAENEEGFVDANFLKREKKVDDYQQFKTKVSNFSQLKELSA